MDLEDIEYEYTESISLANRLLDCAITEAEEVKQKAIDTYYRNLKIESGDIETYYTLNCNRNELVELDLKENDLFKVCKNMLHYHPNRLSDLDFLFFSKEGLDAFKEKYQIGTCSSGTVYSDKLSN